MQFARNVAADCLGQGGKTGAFTQFARVFGKETRIDGEIMFFAAHGVAEDDRRAVGIERPLRIAVIFQRFAGAGDGPFLRFIHGIGDAGRNGKSPLQGFPHILAHPATDFGVSLIRRAVIGIVIERRIPAVGRDFADAVSAVLYVVPECRHIWSVG